MTLAAVATFFLCLAASLATVRWAGKPHPAFVVRVDTDHPGALSWLDEQDRAHRKP